MESFEITHQDLQNKEPTLEPRNKMEAPDTKLPMDYEAHHLRLLAPHPTLADNHQEPSKSLSLTSQARGQQCGPSMALVPVPTRQNAYQDTCQVHAKPLDTFTLCPFR